GKTMSRIRALALLAMAGICTGCLGGANIEVPGEFVPVEKTPPYDVKAVSADGVVLAKRTEENPKNGTLEFWSSAVGNQIASREGYKQTRNEAITSEAGIPGRLITYDAIRSGAPFKYLVGVFVRGDRVVVVEAGGRADSVNKLMPQIRTAMTSVR
ncbi:MAG: hypothetical protein LLG01_05635, partial [Planctomycetaceae bacterium]|nr:hypothetical protein [Planctomycetaceae bacterium]